MTWLQKYYQSKLLSGQYTVISIVRQEFSNDNSLVHSGISLLKMPLVTAHGKTHGSHPKECQKSAKYLDLDYDLLICCQRRHRLYYIRTSFCGYVLLCSWIQIHTARQDLNVFLGVHSQHPSLQQEHSTRYTKKPPGYIFFLDFGEGFILNPSSEIQLLALSVLHFAAPGRHLCK